MAGTLTAVLARLQAPVVGGLSVQYAFSSNEAQNLDLIQIVNPGDETTGPPTVVLNVDYQGKVHNPAVNPTNGTTLGVYFANLANGSTAAFFGLAFANPSLLDIIQVVNQAGGNITYWLDYLGVAHGV
jgi:hypothetical protein